MGKLSLLNKKQTQKATSSTLHLKVMISYKPEILYLPSQYNIFPTAQQIHAQQFQTIGLTINKGFTTIHWEGYIDLRNLQEPLGNLLDLGDNFVQVYGQKQCSSFMNKQLNRKCIAIFTQKEIKNHQACQKQVQKKNCKILWITKKTLAIQIPHFTKYDFNFGNDEQGEQKKTPAKVKIDEKINRNRNEQEYKQNSQKQQGIKFTISSAKKARKKQKINNIGPNSGLKNGSHELLTNDYLVQCKSKNNFTSQLVKSILQKQRKIEQIQQNKVLQQWKNNLNVSETLSSSVDQNKLLSFSSTTKYQYMNKDYEPKFIGNYIQAQLKQCYEGQLLLLLDQIQFTGDQSQINVIMMILKNQQCEQQTCKLTKNSKIPQYLKRILTLLSKLGQFNKEQLNKHQQYVKQGEIKTWLEQVLNNKSQIIAKNSSLIAHLLRRTSQKMIKTLVTDLRFEDAQFLAAIEDPLYRRSIINDQINLCPELVQIKNEQNFKIGSNWLESLGLVLWYFKNKTQKQLICTVLDAYQQQIYEDKLEYSLFYLYAFDSPLMNVSLRQPLQKLLIYWYIINKIGKVQKKNDAKKYCFNLLRAICIKLFKHYKQDRIAYEFVLRVLYYDQFVDAQLKSHLIQQLWYKSSMINLKQYEDILQNLAEQKHRSNFPQMVYSQFINLHKYQIQALQFQRQQKYLQALQFYTLIRQQFRTNKIKYHINELINIPIVLHSYKHEDQMKLLSILRKQKDFRQLYHHFQYQLNKKKI